MKKKRLLKGISVMLMTVIMITAIAACGQKNEGDTTDKPTGDSTNNTSEQTENVDPIGPYDEEITITLGRQTIQDPKLPEGDTYENNAYTRWVKQVLNIKLADEFEALGGEDYDRQVALAITSGELPDIMPVTTRDELRELYENDLIADLTDIYNTYASPYVKEVYDSYDGRALADASFDGKLMGLPGTSGSSTVPEVWIRGDWLKKLGLTVDKDGNGAISITELETVARAFVDKNPGNAQNVVGMAFAPTLTGGIADDGHTMNAVSYAFGAFPRTWLNNNGKVVYGSTTQEMKIALGKVAEWFKSGLADPQLGVRDWDGITALLTNNQLGIAFGPWHFPDWLLSNVYAMDKNATFETYALEDADGEVNSIYKRPTLRYMVVSKECKHPEAAVKILNLFYDVLPHSDTLAQDYPEVAKYLEIGVGGTARPFNIELSKSDAMEQGYEQIKKAVNHEISLDEVENLPDREHVKNIQKYLADPANADPVAWARYHSRMKGMALLAEKLQTGDIIKWTSPIYPETTPTMKTNLANLTKLEEETFIKIVTGAVDVNAGFDKFVEDWNSTGGEKIISEIESQLK